MPSLVAGADRRLQQYTGRRSCCALSIGPARGCGANRDPCAVTPRAFACIFAAALICFSAAARAGQNPAATADSAATSQPAPRRLNLDAALDLAERQNLDLAAARLERGIASAEIRAAGEVPNPSVSFSVTRDEPHESLFFDQPIEIGGQRGRRIDLAREESRLSDLDVTTLERQIRMQVRDAYFGVALALAKTAERVQAQQLAARLRDIAQTRFDAGDVPQLEVLQADLEVARAGAGVQVAQQEEKVAWSELNQLLAEPSGTMWQIEGSLEDDATPATLDDLLTRAGQSSPELQRLAQELDVEQSKESLLRADRVPDLDVEAGADLNSPHDFEVGARGQVSIGVPLFSRNQGEIAESVATQKQLETSTLATRRAVGGRVEQAYFDFEARRTEVDLDRTALLPAGQRLESMAEESYKAGKSDILSVLDAQRDVQDVQLEYLDNLFALQSAYAELEEAVGGPVE